MRRNLLLIPLLLLLGSCASQSGIQRDYVTDQKGCQTMAEQNIDRYLPKGQTITDADRNAQMVTLFSDCMGRQGWQVAKPKKSDEVATSAPLGTPSYPNSYPSGAAAATAAQPAPPATVAQPPAAATRQPSAETTPMGNSPYAPTQPGVPPATYQPAYGTGPGRSF